MKKRAICPECGADKTVVGLPGHRLWKHGVKPEYTANLATSASTLAKNKQEESKVVEGEKHDPAECPNCRRKEFQIVDLEHNLSVTQKEKGELEAKLATKPAATAEKEPVYEIPDLETVVKHCEDGSCADHKAQWEAVKARITQGVLDNLPDQVVESEGLKRGFIPTKIIIPAR